MAEEKEELELTQENSEEQNSDAPTDTSNEEELTLDENPTSDENQESASLADENNFAVKKKNNKLKIILFGVIGLLGVILLIGIILYFTGFFDEEPKKEEPKKEISKQTQQTQQTNQYNQMPKTENYKFSLDDVDTQKLNQELSKLTNKEIKKKKEKEKIQEEREAFKQELKEKEEEIKKERELLKTKKDKLEKQKAELEKLKEQAKSIKEEMIKEKEILELEREKLILAQLEIENNIKQEENRKQIQEQEITNKKETAQSKQIPSENNNSNTEIVFVNLINVAKIKGDLYKDYLDKVLRVHNDVLLCRDDFNNIDIFYGPFNDTDKRSTIYENAIENGFENAYEVELTKSEFERRCNY